MSHKWFMQWYTCWHKWYYRNNIVKKCYLGDFAMCTNVYFCVHLFFVHICTHAVSLLIGYNILLLQQIQDSQRVLAALGRAMLACSPLACTRLAASTKKEEDPLPRPCPPTSRALLSPHFGTWQHLVATHKCPRSPIMGRSATAEDEGVWEGEALSFDLSLDLSLIQARNERLGEKASRYLRMI